MHKGLTRLREVELADHPALTALRADAKTQQMLLGAPEGSQDPVEDWIARRGTDGVLLCVSGPNDAALGFVQITEVHRRNRTAWFGIGLLPEARNQGHGRQATALALDLARDRLALRKLSLKVRADNPAAKLYRSLGFRDVGTQLRDYDDGQHVHDVLIMEYLFDGGPNA